MSIREDILDECRWKTVKRIDESINSIKPYEQAKSKDGELLRQLGMPAFSIYKTKIVEGAPYKCMPPPLEDAINFLKIKRKELTDALWVK